MISNVTKAAARKDCGLFCFGVNGKSEYHVDTCSIHGRHPDLVNHAAGYSVEQRRWRFPFWRDGTYDPRAGFLSARGPHCGGKNALAFPCACRVPGGWRGDLWCNGSGVLGRAVCAVGMDRGVVWSDAPVHQCFFRVLDSRPSL